MIKPQGRGSSVHMILLVLGIIMIAFGVYSLNVFFGFIMLPFELPQDIIAIGTAAGCIVGGVFLLIKGI